MFTSNNEEDEWKESLIIFHKSIGWKIIELKDKWHFTLFSMWTQDFPELLEVILK